MHMVSGSGEGNPDTDIVMSRLPYSSDQWTVPMELSHDTERSEQNPVLFLAPDGELWLLYTSNEPHNQKTARLCVRKSGDRGYTWSPATVLFSEPGIFIKQPCVVLSNGNWLLPAYYCTWDGDYSIVKISTDSGATWQEYPVSGGMNRVQMDVLELEDTTLLAVFRSREADRIYMSRSHDMGRTWDVPRRTELPNNNAQIQMTKLKNGHLMMVYNDVTLEKDQFRVVTKNGKLEKKTLRTPLAVTVSEDNGKTWPYMRYIQMADEKYLQTQEGYSYPAIIQAQDGRIHIAYTYLREAIKHVIIDEEWVKAKCR